MKGNKNRTKHQVQFSGLNTHKFRHNFECISPMCNYGMADEDNEHYLLHCPHFDQSQRGLYDTVTKVLGSDIANLDSIALYSLLLYGSYNLTLVENRISIEAAIDDIKKTKPISTIRCSILAAVISFFFNCVCFVLFSNLFLFHFLKD